jgi:uncharacterized protein
MSTNPPYPGVYIQEIPNSVHTIQVNTSTTAFIDLAKKGPSNKATATDSFAEYERIFGELWRKSNMISVELQIFHKTGELNSIFIICKGNLL